MKSLLFALMLAVCACGSHTSPTNPITFKSYFATHHRAVETPCAANIVRDPNTDTSLTCTTDDDCRSYAAANNSTSNPNVLTCQDGFCSADACHRDEDCTGTATCLCGYRFTFTENLCSPGNCRVDTDCGPGFSCSPSYTGGSSGPSYNCHTLADQCVESSNCEVGKVCAFGAASWECTFDS